MKSIYLIAILFTFSYCSNSKKNLVLRKIDIPSLDQLQNIGTIGDLRIAYLVHEGFLGNSTNDVVLIRNGHPRFAYLIEKKGNEWIRLSNDYLAMVKPYTNLNRGWFLISGSRVATKLPRIEKFVDSLKINFKNCFIQETNGYISIYQDGVLIKELNYGNYITKFKSANFDSLKYSLYQLDGDSLRIVSNTTDDLAVQKDGIFFVPAPGTGVLRRYSKREILKVMDSSLNLSMPPDDIKIKSDQ